MNNSNLYDQREELISTVSSLRKRITQTERTLNSLNSTPRGPIGHRSVVPGSSKQNSPMKEPTVLTVDELRKNEVAATPTSLCFSNAGSARFEFSGSSPSRVPFNAVKAAGDNMTSHSLLSGHTFQSELSPFYNKDQQAMGVRHDLNQSKQITQLQEHVAELETSLQAHQASLSNTDEMYARCQCELNDNKSRLKTCGDLLAQAELRMNEQREMILSLREERDNAVTQVIHSESVRKLNESVQLQLKRKEQELSNLKRHIESYKEKELYLNGELEEKARLIEEQEEEAGKLQLENESIYQKLTKANKQLKETEKKMIDSRVESHQNSILHSEVVKLKSELQQKEEKIIQLSKASLARNEENLDEIALLQQKIASQECNVEQYRTTISTLEEALGQSNSLRMQNAELRNQLDETEKRLVEAQLEFQDTSEQMTRLESLATQLQTQSNSDVTDQLHQLRMLVNAKDDEVCSLRDQLEEVNTKLNLAHLSLEAKERIQRKSQQYASESERSRYETSLARQSEKLLDYETRVKLLNSQYRDLESELGEARRLLISSQKSNTDLRRKNKDMITEYKSLKEKLGEENKQSFSWKTKVKDSQTEVGILEKKVTSLKKEVSIKAGECESYEREIGNLRQLTDQQKQQLSQQREDLKDRLKAVNAELQTSQDEIHRLVQQVQAKTAESDSIAMEWEKDKLLHQTVKDDLTNQIESYTVRIKQLDTDLQAARDSCSIASKGLDQCNIQHRKLAAEKDLAVHETEAKLSAAKKQLSAVEKRLRDAEQAAQSAKLCESQNSSRVMELETLQTQLTQQLAEMETSVSRMKTSHKKELELTTAALQQEVEKCEAMQILHNDIRLKVEEMEQDKEALQTEISQLQSQITGVTPAQVQQLHEELRDKEQLLEAKQLDADDLEDRLQKMELDLERQSRLNAQFEAEFRRAQDDLRNAMSQLQELQDVLGATQEEKRKILTRLEETEGSLRRRQEEVDEKNREIEELDDQIRSQEKQLLTRASQVSQLDVSISTYRSDMESQLRKMREQLQNAHNDINRKTQQLKTLGEHAAHVTSELEVKRKELDNAQAQVDRLDADLSDQCRRVSELQTRLDGLEDKSEGLLIGLGTRTEELTAKNDLIKRYEDQVTRLQNELTKAKTERGQLLEQLNRSKREQQSYLDQMFELEERLTRCESGPVNDANIKTARAELERLQSQHQQEIVRLEQAQSDLLESRRELEEQFEGKLSEIASKEKQLQSRLESANQTIIGLRDELNKRLDLVRNANEAVVIKEGEITRLRARLSGIERSNIESDSIYSTRLNKLAYSNDKLCKEEQPLSLGSGDLLNSSLDELSQRRLSVRQALFTSPGKQEAPSHFAPISMMSSTQRRFNSLPVGLDLPNLAKGANCDSVHLDSQLDVTELSSTHGDAGVMLKDENSTFTDTSSLYQRDDSMKREREILFERLDRLNNQPLATNGSQGADQSDRINENQITPQATSSKGDQTSDTSPSDSLSEADTVKYKPMEN